MKMRVLAVAATVLSVLSPLTAQRGNQAVPAPKGPWMDKSLSPDKRADLVLEQMTADEKLSLLHGGGGGFGGPGGPGGQPAAASRSLGGAGFIPGIARLGIPDLQMADAAVGVTRGGARSRYSTALPSAVSEASSWDPKLAYEYGALIGRELRDQGFNMSLGGGVNLTREPRNGRLFEYKGEDPILAGKLVGQEMKGLQAQGVIGDIKHYALNDQETGRNIGNVILDKRAMRESDLLAFEIGIRDSGVGAVMCSYNKVNGDWACENRYLLNEVLKHAFGFPGFVLSDWGGTHSTTKAALAGLDIEMPGSTYFGDALKKVIDTNDVSMDRVNDMVHRILRTEFAVGLFDNPPDPKVVDVFGGLEVAQRVAEQGTVLLKNADGQLPLHAPGIKSIAIIGSHADVGVLSGGGSAQVDPPGGNAVPPPPPAAGALQGPGGGFGGGFGGRGPVYYPSSPLKAIRARVPNAKVQYDAGTDPAAAAALAKASDIAIVFVNQPTSEGRDAASLSLPDGQDQLVSAVAAANRHTIVVLETGGPVTMPWIDGASAVLEAWYPGIRGAEAIANILFGDVNPSAKLPMTFARSEADLPHPTIAGPPPAPPTTAELARGGTPPFLPGGGARGGRGPMVPFDIPYPEGLKVGYKWFDAENKQPLFAFGSGLSYTTYSYSGLKIAAGPEPKVTFNVKNTGKRAGAEIAQVYVSLPPAAGEPPRRLVAWDKVPLAAGESKTVTLALDPKFLSIFNMDQDGWQLLAGDYKVFVGGSSRETPVSDTLRVP
ncbi:MAG: glycoside hydrolase family 3 C-terminal domain-containing protein [Acidobacteriia bacterium]|nr:glycoside hydrolase family 3 C-terminal domain-containing protein [Terriglobia bacterium]